MPNEGGGGAASTAESFMNDIDEILRCLVSRLQGKIYPVRENGDGATLGERVLLDVEIDDVRLVAVRRGTPSPMSLLSPREREIARMVALGYPNKTIASVLDISSWTVASHLRRAFMKLQVTSRAAMITRLSDPGLTGLPPLRGELTCEPQGSMAVKNAEADPAYRTRYYSSLERDPQRV